MQDIVNARLSGATPTGNGRRESYAYPPMPRMTNTFMREGGHSPEEIVASVENGLYAADFNGGEVDITNGNFVFVSLPRRGESSRGGWVNLSRGRRLLATGPTIMPLVSMVGDDSLWIPASGLAARTASGCRRRRTADYSGRFADGGGHTGAGMREKVFVTCAVTGAGALSGAIRMFR